MFGKNKIKVIETIVTSTQFKVGDQVRLKSGGPVGTISYIDSSVYYSEDGKIPDDIFLPTSYGISVIWYDEKIDNNQALSMGNKHLHAMTMINENCFEKVEKI